MLRNSQFLFLFLLLALPACSLSRGIIDCASGTDYEPGGTLCVPVTTDADVGDSAMIDGGMPVDGHVLTDAGIDAALPDSDSGPVDSGPDTGPTDSGPGPVDAGTDSGPRPDAGMRRCEDTTTGICIRVDGVALIDDWAAQFNWTRPGGSLHRIDWVAGRMDCIGGIRVIDADTTECEIAIPDPGTPVLDTGLAYVYPEEADGDSPCMPTFCPAYHAGWRLWIRGTEYPTDPATPGGRCGLENPACLDGAHAAMRINLP